MPSRGGRAGQGPWARSRLRLPEQDYLESIGLPSKGDKKLLDEKTQEKYYGEITKRYMALCSKASQGDELLLIHSSLENERRAQSTGTTPATSPQSVANTRELTIIMMALRKLREGIVASKRADNIAAQAYLFCIRLSILVKQHESYHPAILHLLRFIHPQHPLTSVELQDVAGYLILDAACRRGDLADAYALRRRYRLHDTKVDGVLQALAHDNYVAFERIKRGVDGHRARVMEFAQNDLRVHTLKCFSRAYFTVDLDYLEKSTGSTWEKLTSGGDVGWELDGKKVTIRRVKGR